MPSVRVAITMDMLSSRSSFARTTLESAKRSFASGDLAGAERLCRSVINSAPELAGPWIILGDIELHRRRPDAALIWADKAIALEPQNPYGYLVRCQCLIASARLQDAFETAVRAVALKDCPAPALDEFGMIFNQLGRYQHSLDCFRRALAADPGKVEYIYNLAAAERSFGQLDESERHCDQVIARDPHFYHAYFIRADLRRQTREKNHTAEMERLLAAGIKDPRGEIMVRFALGKEYEDIGDYARAFGHFRTGAEMKRKRLRFDIRGYVGVMNRVIRSQTREALDAAAARALSAGVSQDDPIFIVGLPRSGTTLIERIVGSHSRIIAGGELGALSNELTREAHSAGITKAGEWADRLDTIDAASLGKAYSRVARETGIADDRRFTDKNPQNVLYCGAIRMALPNARIIMLKRQAMDSCYAMYKQYFKADSFPYSYDLEDLAQYYAAFRRLIDHWRSALPERQYMEVSYEDIVTDLEGQSRRIIDFLGLPWEGDILRFHESAAPVTTASAVQVRQPIYASSVGKWRNYTAQLEPLRARLAELMPGEDLG
jgi:tetratricopeptide (TPR) repeat protein